MTSQGAATETQTPNLDELTPNTRHIFLLAVARALSLTVAEAAPIAELALANHIYSYRWRIAEAAAAVLDGHPCRIGHLTPQAAELCESLPGLMGETILEEVIPMRPLAARKTRPALSGGSDGAGAVRELSRPAV